MTKRTSGSSPTEQRRFFKVGFGGYHNRQMGCTFCSDVIEHVHSSETSGCGAPFSTTIPTLVSLSIFNLYLRLCLPELNVTLFQLTALHIFRSQYKVIIMQFKHSIHMPF
uniref:Uncharacterized protein n=2 Tax=Anguilla anguilla TaxID=7936 RepID=A0A0E9SAN2_ANGAN